MEIAVPTLSSDGFAVDIRLKADTLLSYYFASDFSQSNVFLGQVMSLAYQVQQLGSDPFALKQSLERTLTEYLNRHFDSASVTVTTDEEAEAALYNIQFDATVTMKDQRYSVGKLIEVQNNRVIKIIDRFRNGD